MIDTLLTDAVLVASNFNLEPSLKVVGSFNYWMWLAVIEFIIIIWLIRSLLFRRKQENTKEQFKREAKMGDIDFGNTIKSAFHAQKLYDELIVKCHPDRFPIDLKKNAIASNLVLEISKNKTDYKKLVELKEIAKQKLNIKFNSI